MAILVLACGACERGCLASWLTSHGVGETPSAQSGPGAFPLQATDCPDGLARCTGDTVQVSRLASIPRPCDGPPEKCACPWDSVAGCEKGCVVEGVEIVMPRERAAAQLCAIDPAAPPVSAPPPFAAELPPAPPCDDPGYRCAKGVVFGCLLDGTTNVTPLARCTRGCVDEESILDESDVKTRDQAIAILCAR